MFPSYNFEVFYYYIYMLCVYLLINCVDNQVVFFLMNQNDLPFLSYCGVIQPNDFLPGQIYLG